MARTYLVRGMLAGLLAGLCAFGVAKIIAEPQISRAEAFERLTEAGLGRTPERPVVSRDVQDTVGLGLGVAVTGVALGGIFGLAFAGAYRRVLVVRAKTTAAVLAAAGFVAIFFVPFLKYPANPPSIGSPDTIGRRTALYFLAVLVGVLSVVLTGLVESALSRRMGAWNAMLSGLVALVGVLIVAYVVMPGVNEVPAGFPASVLWRFRLASLATQVTLWAVLGLAFGALTERREASLASA